MSTFPFNEYKIKILTIERPSSELKTLLQNNNYELSCTISDHGETLWVYVPTKDSLDLSELSKICP